MKLLIVGAGGMARCVYSWLLDDIKNKNNLHIGGFLSDYPHDLDSYSYPKKIVGNIHDYEPKKDELLVFAIMLPMDKKKVLTRLLQKGASFYSLIHPSAIIGSNVKIGVGCVVAPNCVITSDVNIGDFVFLSISVNIGHSIKIGDYVSINGWAGVAGNVTIGDGVLLGVGSTIIPKRHIGENATIGAGSVVINHVDANTTVFGNPAKRISL
jgi:sugar O-acyltransferase (sialic acid O-acetyltransferase NeuD family)